MPWKTIRHDVFCMCLGYGGCFFLESDKVPEPFAFTICPLVVLLGITLEKIAWRKRGEGLSPHLSNLCKRFRL